MQAACVNPAALGGGSGELHAYLSTSGSSIVSASVPGARSEISLSARSRNSAPARMASSTKAAPSAVRPFIQVAARRRWAGAADGGVWGCKLDRVDAPWGMEQRRQKMPDLGVSDQEGD